MRSRLEKVVCHSFVKRSHSEESGEQNGEQSSVNLHYLDYESTMAKEGLF
jgi:hypothetical protein